MGLLKIFKTSSSNRSISSTSKDKEEEKSPPLRGAPPDVPEKSRRPSFGKFGSSASTSGASSSVASPKSPQRGTFGAPGHGQGQSRGNGNGGEDVNRQSPGRSASGYGPGSGRLQPPSGLGFGGYGNGTGPPTSPSVASFASSRGGSEQQNLPGGSGHGHSSGKGNLKSIPYASYQYSNSPPPVAGPSDRYRSASSSSKPGSPYIDTASANAQSRYGGERSPTRGNASHQSPGAGRSFYNMLSGSTGNLRLSPTKSTYGKELPTSASASFHHNRNPSKYLLPELKLDESKLDLDLNPKTSRESQKSGKSNSNNGAASFARPKKEGGVDPADGKTRRSLFGLVGFGHGNAKEGGKGGKKVEEGKEEDGRGGEVDLTLDRPPSRGLLFERGLRPAVSYEDISPTGESHRGIGNGQPSARTKPWAHGRQGSASSLPPPPPSINSPHHSPALGMPHRVPEERSAMPSPLSSGNPSTAISAHSQQQQKSSGGFPWSKTRSKSPSPSFVDLPSLDEKVGKGKGLFKGKEKEAAANNWATDAGDESDGGSFRIRGFRHVSSGSGVPPWDVTYGQDTANSMTTPERESVLLPAFDNNGDGSETPKTARARPQMLSRPPSMTGSMLDEPAKQVSVQKFKARRQSTTGSINLEAYRDEMERAMSREQDDRRNVNVSPPRLNRIETRESAVEILASPEKTLRSSFDGFGAQFDDRRRNQDQPGVGQRRASVDQSDRILSNTEILASPVEMEEPQPFAREPLNDGQPTHIARPTSRNKGFVVQRRAFSMAGELDALVMNDKVGRGLTPPPQEESRAKTTDDADPTPTKGHDRSRSASSIGFTGLSIDIGPRTARPSLTERLANVAVTTPPAVVMSDPSECLIPPVRTRSAGPPSPKEDSAATTPTAAHTFRTATSPVKPPQHSRSSSAMSSSSRTKAKTGWEASSSEESDEEERRNRRPKAQAPAGRPGNKPQPARNLPSGIRRPPAPSEAFGHTDTEDDKVFKRPFPVKMASAPIANGSQAGRSSFSYGVKPKRPTKKPQSSSESESEDDSSSDESLAAIVKKQSKTSLSSKFSQSTPNLLSPSKQPMPANSNVSQPASPVKPALRRPAAQTPSQSPSSVRTASRALPTPPVSMMTGHPAMMNPTANLATAQLWPQQSPASSQSGTTGDSSRGGPLTPQEIAGISQPIIMNGNGSSKSGASSKAPSEAARSRRVSFVNADWGQGDVPRSDSSEESKEKKRNERRKAEARAAVELGRVIGATDPAKQQPPAQQQMPMPMGMPNMMQYNPFMGMGMQGGQPMDMQQMMQMQAMQMQMQMDPSMFQMQAQMHQQAMALAKQQYQAAMAAAAIQAADEAWERASSMGGMDSGGTGMPMMPQMTGMMMPPFGGMNFSSAQSMYGGGGSQYGGGMGSGATSQYGPMGRQGWGAASVYGESFGPSIRAPTQMPQRETRDLKSSTSTSRLKEDAKAEKSSRPPVPIGERRRSSEKTHSRTFSQASRLPTLPASPMDHRGSQQGSTPPGSAGLPPSSWKSTPTSTRQR